MAGHNKWSQIKRKKAAIDQKRGKIFAKIIKEISIAAREGGGDPEANPRLRLAIQMAKDANMPQDNITRAIKRGTGEVPGMQYEEVVYEGYGPGGVAILMESVTDNRNRTVAEIRHLLSKHNGRLGEAGSVSWMFTRKGVIRVPTGKIEEDELLQVAIEAGADDMQPTDDYYEITTGIENFEKVKQALTENNIPVDSAELQMEPNSIVPIEGKDAEQVLKLIEALDDHDDVQNVYTNFEIDDEVFDKLAQES